MAAAHIIPWSTSHNDDPRNGMALCHLCHWAFDEGLASVSEGYTVLTSPQLNYEGNAAGNITTSSNRPIIKPEIEYLWPDLKALKWHRDTLYKKV